MKGRQPWSLQRRALPNAGLPTDLVPDMTDSSTDELIDTLMLQKIDSMRSAYVILEVFSLLAVIGMIVRILYDARRAQNLKVTLHPTKFALLHSIHLAERVPLIIASFLALQQLVFIGIGATAIGDLISTDCSRTAQAVFPFIFIVPYAFFVFGAETTYRSLLCNRFGPYSKWTFPVALGAIGALTFFTWIPTAVDEQSGQCHGSLVWWTSAHGTVAVVLLSLLMVSCLGMAITIALQLLKSIKVEANYRIAASRMVYYLVFMVVLIIFILPFYAQASQEDLIQDSTTAEMASVILSITGILFAAWHVFDRANCYKLAFRPVETPWRNQRDIRFFGPNDLDGGKNVLPMTQNAPLGQSTEDLIDGDDKNAVADLENLQAETPAVQMTENLSPPKKLLLPHISTDMSLFGDFIVSVDRSSEVPSVPSVPRLEAQSQNRNTKNYTVFPLRGESGAAESPKYPAATHTSGSRARSSVLAEQMLEQVSTAIRNSAAQRQLNEKPQQTQPPPRKPSSQSERLAGSPASSRQRNHRASSCSRQTVEIGLFPDSASASAVSIPKRGESLARLQQKEGERDDGSVVADVRKAQVVRGNIALQQVLGAKVSVAPSPLKIATAASPMPSPTSEIARKPIKDYERASAALSSYRLDGKSRKLSVTPSLEVTPPPPPTTSLPEPPAARAQSMMVLASARAAKSQPTTTKEAGPPAVKSFFSMSSTASISPTTPTPLAQALENFSMQQTPPIPTSVIPSAPTVSPSSSPPPPSAATTSSPTVTQQEENPQGYKSKALPPLPPPEARALTAEPAEADAVTKPAAAEASNEPALERTPVGMPRSAPSIVERSPSGSSARSQSPRSIHRAGLGLRLHPVTPEPLFSRRPSGESRRGS